MTIRSSFTNVQRSDWKWLAGILSIAFALRLIELNASLWYDEVLTLVAFVQLPTMDVLTSYTSLNNHVLYTLQAKATVALFGESAWSLRMPAVLFGVAGVGALWWLARQVVDSCEARLAAILLAVSYHHVWFSQNARGYTGLFFWGLIATALFLRGSRNSTWAIWTVYAGVIAAGLYTHLSAAFFFVTHAVIYAGLVMRGTLHTQATAPDDDQCAKVWDLKPLFGMALGGALAILLYAPLIPQMIETFTAVSDSGQATVSVTEWTNPIWALLDVVRNVQSLGFIASVGAPIVLLLALIGIFGLLKTSPVIPLVFLLHIPITLAILSALSFRIWPRYFLIDLGFVFLFLVHGVFIASRYMAGTLKSRERWGVSGEAAGVLACAIAIACSTPLLAQNYRYPKQDLRGARDFVAANRTADDTVATVGLASLPFSRYTAPDWEIVTTSEELASLSNEASRTWLVYTFPTHTAVHFPDVVDTLATDFDLVETLPGTLGEGTMFIYRSRN